MENPPDSYDGRTCRVCGEWTPREQLSKAKQCKWGTERRCKRCVAAHSRQYHSEGQKRPRKTDNETDSYEGRVCRICGEWKSRDRLKKNPDTKWGIDRFCLDCAAVDACARAKKLRIERPEIARQRDRKRYERDKVHNPERLKRHRRANYLRHREKQIKQAVEYHKRNPEKSRKSVREWKIRNPEYYESEHFRQIKRVNEANRRARKESLPGTLTTAQWRRCLDYFNHRCCICGQPVGFWHTLAEEHWIAIDDPRPDNPGTVAANILPMCHSVKDGEGGCNNSKGRKDPIEWLYSRFPKKEAAAVLKRIQTYFEWVNQQPE